MLHVSRYREFMVGLVCDLFLKLASIYAITNTMNRYRYAAFTVHALFFTALAMMAPALDAALFDEEDTRQPMSTSLLSSEQRYMGTIVCSGLVQGTGLLLDLSGLVEGAPPVLLTAAHVLASRPEADCFYAPMGDQRRTRSIDVNASHRSGTPLSAVSSPEQRLSGMPEKEFNEQFLGDWVLVSLGKWRRWQQYALELDQYLFSIWSQDEAEKASLSQDISVQLAGYSVPANNLMVDTECHLFSPKAHHLIIDGGALRSEDCEATHGASGGIVFIEHDGRWRPIGLHLGSAFLAGEAADTPAASSAFDLQTNTNVARLIDREIVAAMLGLIEADSDSVDTPIR